MYPYCLFPTMHAAHAIVYLLFVLVYCFMCLSIALKLYLFFPYLIEQSCHKAGKMLTFRQNSTDMISVTRKLLPTRIASNSCSLIDDIFCKFSHQYGQMTGGIFLHTMSDHYPYFVSCNLSVNHSTMERPKYIKKRVNDKLAYVSLLTDLCQSDIANDMI